MENIMRKMLKAITLTGAFLLVIAPVINANFTPYSQQSILITMTQPVAFAFSPTAAYLLATGLISLVISDIRRTPNRKKRR